MLMHVLDYVGSLAFCLAGSALAHQVKFSFFGNFVTTLIAGFAGGCLRDTFLGYIPPAAFQDDNYLLIALVSVVLMHFTISKKKILENFVLFGDALGLAVFTVIGASKAFHVGLGVLQCGVIAVVTTCFGGLCRDIITKAPPFVLVSPFYALTAFLGGVIYFGMMHYGINDAYTTVVVVIFVLGFRILSDRKTFFGDKRRT